jgi:hypothetical protein
MAAGDRRVRRRKLGQSADQLAPQTIAHAIAAPEPAKLFDFGRHAMTD